jgi:arylsulfatase A
MEGRLAGCETRRDWAVKVIFGGMKKLKFVLVFIGALATAAAVCNAAAPRKPNIIFILADDLGIGNVGCYGADHFQTPNIDKLAQSGMRFEHCYAAPLCGPSRALLLTGRYAYHTGMTGNDSGPLIKPEHETMIPSILKPAGYVTGMCGKWSQLPLQPGDFGFDEYLRFSGSGKYWNTQKGNKYYTRNGENVPLKNGEYLPDTMHKFVVDFIERHRDQPFYIHYAMSQVHAEILPTPDTAPGTTNKFQIYQDNVAYMDKLVGKLLAELDRLKLRDNTLIVFAGDNGTAQNFAPRCTINGGKALSGMKGEMLECGALVPCLISWAGQVPAGKVPSGLISFADFLPTLAEIAGAKMPASLVVDGKTFAPQLLGRSETWPRDWVFVELGRHWYDREMNWKLNEAAELFDMQDAPYAEPLVATNTANPATVASRARLQSVLNQLNPAGGIVDPGDGSGRHAANVNRAAKKTGKKGKAGGKAPTKSELENGPDD